MMKKDILFLFVHLFGELPMFGGGKLQRHENSSCRVLVVKPARPEAVHCSPLFFICSDLLHVPYSQNCPCWIRPPDVSGSALLGREALASPPAGREQKLNLF